MPASLKNDLPADLLNCRRRTDGLCLMAELPDTCIQTAFFDPQYRGILDKQKYGNEGLARGKRRSGLIQMSEDTITAFIKEINRLLVPSGHLFLWTDKFHLCEGTNLWTAETNLQTVDLIVWEKPHIGMGYRTRNKCEFMLVLQKHPVRARGCWHIKNIPNVWQESADTSMHPHSKPLNLQKRLIEATTREGDIVLDPAMGSGSVMTAALELKRQFIGGDIAEIA